ncbi:uncharacterized protein BO87DRAFT_370674 [Aspergillus neoniger CBS 115656]|uniref:Uncharacterized protein n=1 Tax=Aspergillus neoniger (strain CBS 115656) TaxID=1448310 RepID=A0A318Y2R5_ASPNB|nr:hypothetical protein BO87DRAFT_370674 [Aspergillus neoniger CBS 115656]PYH28611.1 hypothetical protein BO87DRAFT_370674 [Aspergillus neoniger CBS 115656]
MRRWKKDGGGGWGERAVPLIEKVFGKQHTISRDFGTHFSLGKSKVPKGGQSPFCLLGALSERPSVRQPIGSQDHGSRSCPCLTLIPTSGPECDPINLLERLMAIDRNVPDTL